MKLTIGRRILLGLGLVELLALGVGLYMLSTLRRLRSIESTIKERDFTTLETLNALTQKQGALSALRERTGLEAERLGRLQAGLRPHLERVFTHDLKWVGCQYPTASLAQDHADSSLINNIMFQAGLSFWLPTSFDYTTFR